MKQRPSIIKLLSSVLFLLCVLCASAGNSSAQSLPPVCVPGMSYRMVGNLYVCIATRRAGPAWQQAASSAGPVGSTTVNQTSFAFRDSCAAYTVSGTVQRVYRESAYTQDARGSRGTMVAPVYQDRILAFTLRGMPVQFLSGNPFVSLPRYVRRGARVFVTGEQCHGEWSVTTIRKL